LNSVRQALVAKPGRLTSVDERGGDLADGWGGQVESAGSAKD